jgi:DNA-directed RNA polymerase specialized sigma24 family protein
VPPVIVAEAAPAARPDISVEQIRQLMIDHERLITLIDGIQRMNNARKEEQVLKIAKNLLQTAEDFEDAKSWFAVKPCIEVVYPNFFKKLNAAVTEELTDFEIRVCLSQIFDLTSKEIAQITNRSVRTIETTVYKIRKKLMIPTEIRLSDFLRSL